MLLAQRQDVAGIRAGTAHCGGRLKMGPVVFPALCRPTVRRLETNAIPGFLSMVEMMSAWADLEQWLVIAGLGDNPLGGNW
jgi:hypothetical protein